MKQNLPFNLYSPVYRNTWKNPSGFIRTNLYKTEESAQNSALSAKNNLYQEIATPVWPHECFLNPRERYA